MVQRRIKIISLNIQHGWNTRASVPPVYLSEKRILKNLDNITDLIKKYDADVVLLQEVDRLSPLTKRIDQLSYIQARTGHEHGAYGASTELQRRGKIVYSAGCGIISRFPMTEVENVKFELSFPTPRKGFLSATLRVSDSQLTVVSVHLPLEFPRQRSRELQIEKLTASLSGKRSIVIGGDLNGSMRSKHMKALMQRLDMTTHRFDERDTALHTYPSSKPLRRIDWILTSSDLGIADYCTFEDQVSDHRAVGTTVCL